MGRRIVAHIGAQELLEALSWRIHVVPMGFEGAAPVELHRPEYLWAVAVRARCRGVCAMDSSKGGKSPPLLFECLPA